MARLGEVCEILNGFAFKSEQYVDFGIRIIRISNVQKGYIEDNTPVFYPIESCEAHKYMLNSGDLLMSLTGNVGRVALIQDKFLPAALNQRVACLKIKSEKIVDKGFLFNLLNSDYFERKCIESSKGVAQKNMSTKWLKEYEISLPPLSEQRNIAAVLDKITSLIPLRKQQLTKLDELVKSRFIEMFGTPENNEKQFQVKPLGEICAVERGGSPRPIAEYITDSEGGVNWIKIGDADGTRYISTTAEKIIPEGVKKSRMVQAGDLILSNSMSFGHPYILRIDGCIHDGWLVLHFDHEVLSPLYLQTYLSLPTVYAMFETMAAGGVVNNLNSKIVKKLPILVPPIDLQKQFATFVRQIDKSKLTIQQSLDKLEVLKKSLMQQYFE